MTDPSKSRERSCDLGVVSDSDQEPGVVRVESVDEVPAEAPRIGAQRKRRVGRQAAHPGERLCGEADMAPLGGPLTRPGVHDLAGVVAHRHQRVIAQPPDVPKGGAAANGSTAPAEPAKSSPASPTRDPSSNTASTRSKPPTTVLTESASRPGITPNNDQRPKCHVRRPFWWTRTNPTPDPTGGSGLRACLHNHGGSPFGNIRSRSPILKSTRQPKTIHSPSVRAAELTELSSVMFLDSNSSCYR